METLVIFIFKKPDSSEVGFPSITYRKTKAEEKQKDLFEHTKCFSVTKKPRTFIIKTKGNNFVRGRSVKRISSAYFLKGFL